MQLGQRGPRRRNQRDVLVGHRIAQRRHVRLQVVGNAVLVGVSAIWPAAFVCIGNSVAVAVERNTDDVSSCHVLVAGTIGGAHGQGIFAQRKRYVRNREHACAICGRGQAQSEQLEQRIRLGLAGERHALRHGLLIADGMCIGDGIEIEREQRRRRVEGEGHRRLTDVAVRVGRAKRERMHAVREWSAVDRFEPRPAQAERAVGLAIAHDVDHAGAEARGKVRQNAVVGQGAADSRVVGDPVGIGAAAVGGESGGKRRGGRVERKARIGRQVAEHAAVHQRLRRQRPRDDAAVRAQCPADDDGFDAARCTTDDDVVAVAENAIHRIDADSNRRATDRAGDDQRQTDTALTECIGIGADPTDFAVLTKAGTDQHGGVGQVARGKERDTDGERLDRRRGDRPAGDAAQCQRSDVPVHGQSAAQVRLGGGQESERPGDMQVVDRNATVTRRIGADGQG